MPRISAEARGSAAFRAGKRPPAPPKSLSPDAAEIWVSIAATKPADWFVSGAEVLLERFCRKAIEARLNDVKIDRLREAGADRDVMAAEKHGCVLDQTLATLATKLRISVQAMIERHSAKIGERGDEAASADRLLGGAAVWAPSDRAN